MRNVLPALIVGTIFGAGLALSDMVNPARVLAFLDLLGDPDPTLAFVMAGALVPSAVGYAMRRHMRQPLLASEFRIPQNRIVDPRLGLGAALFGVGWGLAGLCPGPAIAGLAFGYWQLWVFVAAMVAGMGLHRIASARPARLPLVKADA